MESLTQSARQNTRYLASFPRFKPFHIIESLGGLLHNPPAFTSPVDEVLRGVRTRGLGWGLWEAPARFFWVRLASASRRFSLKESS